MAVPFLNNIDLNKYELQNFKIFNIAGDPTGGTLVSGDAGYTWLNTSTNKIRWWDGAAIRDFLDTSSSISGSQISGNISGNAATATSATTAATCTGNSATVTVTQNQFLVGNSSNIGASTAKNSIPISGFGAATADVDLGSKKIVSLADPTAAQDAATKKYVDDTSQGLDIKQSCVAASTAALPSYVATGTAGTAGAYLEASANGTFPTEIQYISSPQVGDRVLVKNETSTLAKWNGIYTIADVGGALAKWKLTRAADFDAGTATSGSFVFIEQGSTLGGTGWVMTTSGTITINSTAITWTQFSGAGSYGANRGIVLDTSTNQFNFAQNSDYTAGRIPFASSTTAIGFDGGLNWDNTNKRLGIGTASPSKTLDVNGEAKVNNLLWFTPSSGSTAIGVSGTNFNIYNGTGAETRLTVDQSGNLGLGVVPSAWNSSYKALDIGSASIFGRSSGNDVYFNQSVYYGSSNWYYKYSSMAVGRYEMSNGSHYWLNAPSGTAGATQSVTSGQQYTVTTLGNTTLAQWQALFSGLAALPTVGQTITATATGTLAGTATFTQIVSFSTLATLNSTGLGIGMSPNASQGKVQVNAALASTIDCGLRITDNATTSLLFNNTGSGASAIWSSGSLAFGTGNNTFSQKLVIDTSGNVSVGTASAFGTLTVQRYTSTPYTTLTIGDIATPANSVGIYGRVTSGDFTISTAGGAIRFSQDIGATARLTIASTGAATFTSTVSATSGIFGGTGASNVTVGSGGIYNGNVSDSSIYVVSDGGSSAGIVAYGSTHATKPSILELRSGSAVRATFSATGTATFTGTVTVKSNSGTGTGYAPAIYNSTLTGDGSTTAFTVTHNFSNPKPIVQVWQKGSPYGLVYADITSNSTGTTTTITFATAPASGTDYWVTVLG